MDAFEEAGGKLTAADGKTRLQAQLSRARAAVAYLCDRRHRSYQPPEAESVGSATLDLRDMALFRIDEITYEEKGPRREAMENIFGTFRNIRGVNLLYLILGDAEGVHFYLGVARDKSYQGEMVPNLIDIGNYILAPAIRGNFRGCTSVRVLPEEKGRILDEIRAAEEFGILEGVPTLDEGVSAIDRSSKGFQGVERLVDVMLGDGDTFGLVVIAKPYADAEIDAVEGELHALYDLLAPLAHTTLQYAASGMENETTNQTRSWERNASHAFSKSDGTSDGAGDNHVIDHRKDETSNVQVSTTANWSTGQNHNDTKSHQHTRRDDDDDIVDDDTNGWNDSGGTNSSSGGQRMDNYTTGIAFSDNQNDSWNHNHTKTKQKNWNVSDGHRKSQGWNTSTGTAQNAVLTYQMELERKAATDWMKYIDDILLPRLDNGRGKGLFLACAYVFGNMPTTVLRLANTLISLYSGSKGNKTPLVFHDLSGSAGSVAKALKNLQVPQLPRRSTAPPCLAAGLSRHVTKTVASCGNWLSSDQLSILAGMPQKEVIGLRLREEVEFGLNVAPPPAPPRQEGDSKLTPEQLEKDKLLLGHLVQSGSEQKNMPVYLSRANLDKHVFVTGVTGGGKTMTCQNLLMKSEMPFLVIEPAKTEYRILKDKCPDLIIFTPGDNNVAPFFLNPFELFPGESITSRADMLKATFEATFEMQAAIPQILEAAIYRVYEDKGWNIGTSRWLDKEPDAPDGPFADGVYAFPTLQEYYDIMPTIIREQGFDERLYSEYLGTVRAFLQGLLVGAKGMTLNVARSVDFRDLVNRHVVIELDAIRSGAEKSLIIGFVLTNLLQAVRAEHDEASKKKEEDAFRHITLVEEAHRLMSRYEPGDSLSKKHGVEVFANMLAEVRKYGESMIIADQIPDKMTPEVLKNTNTKIVHKLFAQDDKEAIGNTMALNKEQKAFLSNLVAGRAIVFSQNWSKAVQVQVEPVSWTTGYKEIEGKEIRPLALKYYQEHKARGCLRGLEHVAHVTEADVDAYLRLMADNTLPKRVEDFLQTNNETYYQRLVEAISERRDWGRPELLFAYFCAYSHHGAFHEDSYAAWREFFDDVIAGKAWPYEESFGRMQFMFSA